MTETIGNIFNNLKVLNPVNTSPEHLKITIPKTKEKMVLSTPEPISEPAISLKEGYILGNGTSNELMKYPEVSPHDLSVKNKPLKCRSIKRKRSKCNGEFFRCNICAFLSLEETCMLTHITKEHSINNSSVYKRQFKCPGCANSFTERRALKTHLTNYHRVLKKDLMEMLSLAIKIEVSCTEQYEKRSIFCEEDVKSKTEPIIAPCLLRVQNDKQLLSPTDAEKGTTSNDRIVFHNQFLDSGANGIILNEGYDGNITATSDSVLNYTNLGTLDTKMSTLIITNIQIEDIDTDVLNLANSKVDGKTELPVEMKVAIPKLEPKPEYFQRNKRSPPINGKVKTDSKQKRAVKVTKPFVEELIVKHTTKEPKLYKCSFDHCNVRMKTQTSIEYHDRCHGNGSFVCPECHAVFQVWNCLRGHLWRQHRIDIELYSCDTCDYKTFSLSKLNNIHKLIHSESKTFLCDICAKAFKNPKQLRNHKIIHKPKYKELSAKCDICQRAFANKRLLKLHVEGLHQQLKRFLCNYCGYKANSKSAVQLHERKHTGQRPYACELCSYTTADHNSLRRHNLRHSGQFSYKCSFCNYACIQSSTFKIHLKSKHPNAERDITFSCKLCNFKSLREDNYLGHIAKHKHNLSQLLKDVGETVLQDENTTSGLSMENIDKPVCKDLYFPPVDAKVTADDPLGFTQNILDENLVIGPSKAQILENTLVQTCETKIDLPSLPMFLNSGRNVFLNQNNCMLDKYDTTINELDIIEDLKMSKNITAKNTIELTPKGTPEQPSKFLFVSTNDFGTSIDSNTLVLESITTQSNAIENLSCL